jgi:glycolate oxidase FAD binding subunit
MPTITSNSSETITPATQAEVADAVRSAHEASRAVYPLGGGTALDYGIAPTQPGDSLDLTSLNLIVDYTPRDMTIIVEAGMRMAELASKLAAEGQQLPIDVPRAAEATLGGVIATNWSSSRRYGHGTIRDYVIGINAVDGRGTAFKGGGRVVKNVAGYDFCKLLTGSLGTLAVITQVALKVKPKPECAATIVGSCDDLNVAERALERLALLETPASAIDLLAGPGWAAEVSGNSQIAVLLEGTESEISWLTNRVIEELQRAGSLSIETLTKNDADAFWQRLVEFGDAGATGLDDQSPMLVKTAVPPSAVTNVIGVLHQVDSGCTVQAHAGNGIILARFSNNASQLSKAVVGKLRPAAVNRGGSFVVARSREALTPHIVWGGRSDATVLLERVKQQFDPQNVLNPGRFIY